MRHRSLPLLEVPLVGEAPELKRLNLPQGQLAQLCPSQPGFHYLAWMELKPGGVRGNHYHHEKEEWLYLIEGELELTVEDPESGERARCSLLPGDLVIIQAGIAHALLPKQIGQGIEFSPAPFDPADTVAHPLVDG